MTKNCTPIQCNLLYFSNLQKHKIFLFTLIGVHLVCNLTVVLWEIVLALLFASEKVEVKRVINMISI